MIRVKQLWPYFILITTIIILVYINQKIVSDQLMLSKKNDLRINFSGRQRMLSQKLAKNSYQYFVSGVKPASMQEDLQRWNKVHEGLQKGDTAFSLAVVQVPRIQQMITGIDPVQKKLSSLYQKVLLAPPSLALLDSISATEPLFLKKMDEIVFAMQGAADDKITDTESTERMMLIASGLLVALEILIIMLPYNRKLERANKENQRQKLEILKREEQQQELYHRYDLTIKGANAGIWFVNLHNDKVILSDKFYELIGYTAKELPATKEVFSDFLLHPEDRTRVLQARSEHLTTRIPYRVEARLKNKGGYYKWFEITGQAEWDITGGAMLMAGSIIDVEERVRSRQQLEYDGYLLYEAGKMAKIGGWYYEGETKEVTWNDAIYEIFDTTKEDQSALPPREKRYPEEYRLLIRQVTEDALVRKKSFSLIAEIFTAKGNRKWVKILGRPVENQYGIVTGIRGVFQDIDEQKKKEIELEQTRLNLQEINSSKDKIFSIIAHDLKSPVATLETLLSMYNKSKVNPETIDKYIASMQLTTRNLINTMDNLFNWANSQMNGFVKKTERFNIKEVIDMAASLYEEAMHQKGIKIQNVSSVTLVLADRSHCFLILRNLINNAVKFTSAGGIISIDTERYGSMARVNIRDTGKGIDKELVERIKNDKVSFGDTGGTGDENGSGLGLSLCLEMARENGGQIQVNSVLGKGSTFSLLLPAQMPENVAPPATEVVAG